MFVRLGDHEANLYGSAGQVMEHPRHGKQQIKQVRMNILIILLHYITLWYTMMNHFMIIWYYMSFQILRAIHPKGLEKTATHRAFRVLVTRRFETWNGGTRMAGWFTIENPTKMHDSGGTPIFWKPPCYFHVLIETWVSINSTKGYIQQGCFFSTWRCLLFIALSECCHCSM